MNSVPIRFIYFDVGGVALLDFSGNNKWTEMLDGLGLTDSQRPPFNSLFDEYSKHFSLGMDPSVFVSAAKEMLGIQFPAKYNMTVDFVNRFEKNPPMLELFQKLRKDFQIGLLTDQYPGMLKLIFNRDLIPSDLWDVVIDSSVEKLKKPSPEIYELAAQRAGVEPGEILFVDNKPKLLEVPHKMGWRVFAYDPANPVESTELLEAYIYKNI